MLTDSCGVDFLSSGNILSDVFADVSAGCLFIANIFHICEAIANFPRINLVALSLVVSACVGCVIFAREAPRGRGSGYCRLIGVLVLNVSKSPVCELLVL